VKPLDDTVADGPGPPAAHLSLRKVQALLGLPARVVTGLIEAGVVTPTRGPRHSWRFTFQDVVLLRTAHRLRTAQVPSRKLLRALARVKAALPAQLPLSSVRLAAVDRGVVVQEGALRWDAESGQLLMDFAEAAVPPRVRHLVSAADWFAQALAQEAAGDAVAAEAAYRRAVEADPSHADAWLNLGALCCEQGRCAEAAEWLAAALAHHPEAASLHFNLALALEDLAREDEAIAHYERALALAPGLADAHFNLARLHERAGRPHRAGRHYRDYRRLLPDGDA
jgi:tetratricopeptide (TPR) repeat protein